MAQTHILWAIENTEACFLVPSSRLQKFLGWGHTEFQLDWLSIRQW